jgi:hypothetical protein
MTKRERRLVVWANVVIVAGLGVWYFGVATLFVLETRYVGWKFPVVEKTPRELADLSISSAPGQRLSRIGYEFEVPWEVDEERTKQIGKTSVVIAFRSGNAVLFSRMPPKEFVNKFQSLHKGDEERLKLVFGEDALKSDYSLIRLILETRPDQVTLLTPRKDAVARSVFLLMKGIMVPAGGETGIFRIGNNELQGFQYGDPQRRPKSIDVEIFSDQGGVAFLFGQREKGPAAAITQAEINRVIQSVRKVPEENLSASR